MSGPMDALALRRTPAVCGEEGVQSELLTHLNTAGLILQRLTEVTLGLLCAAGMVKTSPSTLGNRAR